MTQERLGSCLILVTYKEQVDKLKLVEVENLLCFKNEGGLLFHLRSDSSQKI